MQGSKVLALDILLKNIDKHILELVYSAALLFGVDRSCQNAFIVRHGRKNFGNEFSCQIDNATQFVGIGLLEASEAISIRGNPVIEFGSQIGLIQVLPVLIVDVLYELCEWLRPQIVKKRNLEGAQRRAINIWHDWMINAQDIGELGPYQSVK